MNKERILNCNTLERVKRQGSSITYIRNQPRERFDRKKLPGRKVVQGHFGKYKVRTLTHEFQVSLIQRSCCRLDWKNKTIEYKYVHILLFFSDNSNSTLSIMIFVAVSLFYSHNIMLCTRSIHKNKIRHNLWIIKID